MLQVLSVKKWAQAIPQYNVGHQHKLQQLQAAIQSAGHQQGIILAGNYLNGVAFGQCIENGVELGRSLGKRWPQAGALE